MTVSTFRSIDYGAPVLNGEFGAFFNVLNTCLVTGYAANGGAGWTNPYFDAQNNYVLRTGLPGYGFCLRIADQYTDHANFAVMAGFSSMTGLNVGEDCTPTVLQSLYGVGLCKSITANTVARNWLIVANQRFFYLFICADGSSDFTTAEGYCFGQFDSFRVDDEFNCILIGRDPVDFSIGNYSYFANSGATNAAIGKHWLMRSYTQIGAAVPCGKHYDISKTALPFPNLVDGNLYLSPVFITESTLNCVRGKLPGLWAICHNKSYFNHGDVFTGNGDLAGKTFMVVKVYNGAFALETSDTWDA
jgi:hypothetical protein